MTIIERGPLHDLLALHGYRLVEDAWSNQGRRTYVHEDNATRSQFIGLGGVLRHLGWTSDKAKLRSFIHSETGEVIEVEPRGADTTGHFLHHMTLR